MSLNSNAQQDDLKQTFSKISQLYDQGRPDYPAEIYAETLAMLNLPVPLRILEVGCGTGKGTQLFAGHGHDLLAIDISAELIAVARQHVAGIVQFKVCAFEQLEVADSSFDLIVSAQAYHWVAPEIRYTKAHRLLSEHGGIALFWNVFDLGDSPILTDVRRLCLEQVPSFAGWPESGEVEFEKMKTNLIDEVNASHLFQPAELSVLTRIMPYTPEKLIRLLTTYSWFQSQAETTQNRLLDSLIQCLKDVPSVNVPTRSVLVKAKKDGAE